MASGLIVASNSNLSFTPFNHGMLLIILLACILPHVTDIPGFPQLNIMTLLVLCVLHSLTTRYSKTAILGCG